MLLRDAWKRVIANAKGLAPHAIALDRNERINSRMSGSEALAEELRRGGEPAHRRPWHEGGVAKAHRLWL